jgi:glyoxylase-like metal-dependent hydrolase (beta-lactamase superfamily II)
MSTNDDVVEPADPNIKPTPYGARIGDVEFIWARNSKEFLFSNSILIHGPGWQHPSGQHDKPVIVDPSASFTYIEQLAQSHRIHMVLNTHYHGDHRSLNHLFTGAIYAAHENDAPAIADFKEYARISVEDQTSFYFEWMQGVFKKYQIVDCPVAVKFKDGDVIDTGSEKIHIVHIPGHTPGHSALYFEKADLLYTADIDLTPYGPWYANIVSDIAAFKKSIQKVRDIQCRYYVPSHGERIYDRERFLEKLERYNAHFASREGKILELLKEKPQDMATLCSHGIVYKQASLIDPLKCFFQLKMVEKHLEDFVKKGVVKEEGGVFLLK